MLQPDLPVVRGSVESGVGEVVHQRLYASVANGVLAADPNLEALSFVLQSPPFSLDPADVGYTRVGDIGAGDTAGYITIGTDYADNNRDSFSTTSVLATYTVTLADPISQTFIGEFSGIMDALEANDFAILNALIGVGALTMQDYLNLKGLQIGMTESPGGQDGAIIGGVRCSTTASPTAAATIATSPCCTATCSTAPTSPG